MRLFPWPRSHRAATGNHRSATRWTLPGWAAKCQWRLLEWPVMDQPNAPAYRLIRRPLAAAGAGPATSSAGADAPGPATAGATGATVSTTVSTVSAAVSRTPRLDQAQQQVVDHAG